MRELYTMRMVNTLTFRLTEKWELGFKSRGDSNEEPEEQPIGRKSSIPPIWKLHSGETLIAC